LFYGITKRKQRSLEKNPMNADNESPNQPSICSTWRQRYLIHKNVIRPIALATIVVVALMLRFGLIFSERLWETAFVAEDWPIAQNIAAGNGFSATALHPCGEFVVSPETRDQCLDDFGVDNNGIEPTSQKSPGVPALLALALLIGGLHPFLWFQLLHAIVGAAACWWLGRLGERVFNASTGLTAALLLAFYVPLIWWVKYPGEHILAGAILLVILLTLHRLETNPNTSLFFGWGALIGFGGLFSADVLLPAPFFAAWIAWRHRRRGWTRATAGPIAAGLAAFLVIAPWTARNYDVHDEFVLLRTGFGTALWWGNHPKATGTDWSFTENTDGQLQRVPGLRLMPDALKRELAQMSETEQESRLTQEALSWIISEPKQAAGLFLKKIGYYWWFVYDAEVEPIPIAREIGWSGLLLFAIFGSFLALRRSLNVSNKVSCQLHNNLSAGMKPVKESSRGFVLQLIVPIGASMLFHAITVVSSSWRMRLPIEPILLLFAAYAITYAWGGIIKRQKSISQRA
jgi:hypothetical protein